MKIIYINNTRIPTKKAHSYQICKMCEEFALAGAEVELWFPARLSSITENVFNFYNVKPIFLTREIKSFDWLSYHKYLGKLSFWLHSLFFFSKLFFVRVDHSAIIYTRNIEIAWLFSFRKNKVIYEDHRWPESKVWLYKFLARANEKIVAITSALKKLYLDNGFSSDKIEVAPDGVDLDEFNIKISQAEARQQTNLPSDKKIAIYTGHLYEWKGSQTLAEAADFLTKDYLVLFLGGTVEDIKEFNNKNSGRKNILIAGHMKHSLMPLYLKAADVLILPNSGYKKISSHYTSPLKLFEYMASGRPIIASDLPSIREILSEKNCLFFKPDDPKDLARKIEILLNNKDLAVKIAEQAYEDVKNYTWEKRAINIINYIK